MIEIGTLFITYCYLICYVYMAPACPALKEGGRKFIPADASRIFFVDIFCSYH